MSKESRFGLRGKVTLGLAFMLIASLFTTSILSYLQSQQVAERKAIELEKNKLEVLKHVIESTLEGHQNTLLSLRAVPPLNAIVRAQLNNGIDPASGDSIDVWKKRLQTIFFAFITNNTEYLQIRYIDDTGQEVVRAQVNKKNKAEIVSESLLQNKADREYVKQTLKMPYEQVYFSDVTLNKEHGVIQTPYQPVLRIAAPVYTNENEVKGLIIINLSTEKLFDDVELDSSTASHFLANENGNYILHGEANKTFASEKGFNYNFKTDYPQLAAHTDDNDQLMRLFNENEEILGFDKIYFSSFDNSRYWLLILRVPESIVFADIRASLNQMLIVGLAIGVLSLVLIVWFVTRRILTPVLNLAKAAESLQEGDLTIRLNTQSVHDEFRTLYETLNTFTIKQQQYTVKLQQEIESQTSKLSSIIENVVDGIITIDNKGTIKTFNQSASKMFGYQDEEVLGQNIKMLMPEPYHSEHDGYLSNYIGTNVKKIIGIGREVVGLRKNGSQFPLDLAVSEVRIDNTKHFIGITRDVTERKRMELMQKEFISTVSHELRTPLTSISGSLGLILGGVTGELPEKTRALITIANNNSERLIHLINDILDIEKISAGKMQFDYIVINLTPLIKQSLEENKGYGEKLNIRFNLALAPEEDVLVKVDEKRILQVMSNILSNAAKYSPSGEQVDIKIELLDAKVRISVHDHGKGIPKEFQGKIFNKFSQADSSDTRQKGGTGLGLNITQAIVLQHNGIIDFNSDKENGTTFYVDLPLYIKQATAKKSPADVNKGDENKPFILIVEDDHDVSELLKIMLQNEGYLCDQAYDYNETTEKIEINKYDAITLDLILPGGSGVNILRQLRNNEATLHVPVIIVSAIADKGKKEVAYDAFEMVDWIEKPIDTNRLIKTIKASLSNKNKGIGRILHVEDDPDITAIVNSLLDSDFNVSSASSLQQAKNMLNNNEYDLILLDIGLPDGSGLDILPLLQDDEHQIPVVIFSAQDAPEGIASKMVVTLVKSKTNNEHLMKQIKNAISRKLY